MEQGSSAAGALTAANQPSSPKNDAKLLVSLYSNYLWNQVLRFLPKSNPSSKLFSIISSMYSRVFRGSGRRRRGRKCLPLPLPRSVYSSDYSSGSAGVTSEASMICSVLEDVMECTMLNLHDVQKNLQFWQSKAEASNYQKAYFMVCQRGPQAFVSGIIQFVRGSLAEGTGVQDFYYSASSYISERISLLSNLRYHLSSFLAQVYMEIDKNGEVILKEPEKSVHSLIVIINDLFLKLEASIGHLHAMRLSGSSVDGSYSFPLIFEKLPEVNPDGSQWTYCETRDAVNLIYKNLQNLDSYLSTLVSNHRRPRKLMLHWMRYAGGAVCVSVGSLWVLRHSRFMGSSDIDRWIHEAKESFRSFSKDHVELPLYSIRDELLETFRKRNKGVMEREEVALTADSLHRMLLAFSEQTKGQKLPPTASDQEMLEIVMGRYEKELMHPIQNLLGGELVRALLIQVQKLKLDIETAMLELDQILRANEINFAILAALPAFFLSLILLMFVRAWLKQDARAEGRGRAASIQRRIIVLEIERGILEIQTCKAQGSEIDAESMFGMVLYGLDRLYCAVEKHAQATGEWRSLRQDILDLAKPGLPTDHKLIILSRLVRVYDCLLPSLKRK